VTGYTAAEIVGRELAGLYSSDARADGQPDRDLAQAAKAGSAAEEGWRVRKDGRLIWSEIVLTALRDEAGALTGFTCILRDLTEVEAAEARRRVRAEQLAALAATQKDVSADGLDLAVLLPRIAARARELTNADAAVIELREGSGDRARAHVGFDSLDVQLREILVPQGGATSGAKLQCLRYDEKHESTEIVGDMCDRVGVGSAMAIPLIHDRGTLGWLCVMSQSGQAFGDHNASTLELMATLLGRPLAQAQDSEARRTLVAEKSRAQAAQRESELRFRAAMDASLDALFIAGAVRDHRGAIVDFTLLGANRRAEELCGLSQEGLVGRRITDVPEVARQLSAVAKLASVVESRTPLDNERESTNGDRPRWIHEQIVPLEDGVTITVRDVTARKLVDTEVRRAREAAESANRAKTDFVARMSHELRTPLNSVIGFANILIKNKRGALDTKELAYLQRMLAAGTHLLALINDVLDLSKVEAGRMTLDVDVVELVALTQGVLAQLDTQAGGVALRLEAGAEPLNISADAGKLRQVLLNIVGNALKFTKAGSVTVRLVAQPAPTAGEAAIARCIEVVDTGIGIPADRLSAVFDAFEQGESSTSRRYGGTGLGLAISRALCEAMGFTLEVESVFGEGTVFRIGLQPT
jgi:PAS domain S-box-containing protein